MHESKFAEKSTRTSCEQTRPSFCGQIAAGKALNGSIHGSTIIAAVPKGPFSLALHVLSGGKGGICSPLNPSAPAVVHESIDGWMDRLLQPFSTETVIDRLEIRARGTTAACDSRVDLYLLFFIISEPFVL